MSWDDKQGPWGPTGGSQKPEEPKKPDSKPQSPWGRFDNDRRRDDPGGSHPGGPPNNSVPPPDFDELWRKFKAWQSPLKPKGPAHVFLAALAILGVLWLASGIYMVGADQLGVVMRFGAFNRTENPGLHYRLPFPFEDVLLPVVTAQNEITIGFRKDMRSPDETLALPHESLMLTHDENIVNVEYTVFWRVGDVRNYLFEIRDPRTTIKMAAESVMREVIGQNKLQFALTDGRAQIADEARTRLQALMDEYKAGIVVTQINLQKVSAPDEVKAAFQDVVNARLDMERFQNQAAAHVNKVIPDAKGQAAKLKQQAIGYRDQKIAIAQGEADRFKEVLAAYNASRDVTAKRLYLETMESVLSGAQKIITDKSAGTVPLYPLHDLLKKKQTSGEGSRP